MHTLHPAHLPSWKMEKKSTRTHSLTTLHLSIIERLGSPMGQDHPGDGLSNGTWDTLIRIGCSCNGDWLVELHGLPLSSPPRNEELTSASQPAWSVASCTMTGSMTNMRSMPGLATRMATGALRGHGRRRPGGLGQPARDHQDPPFDGRQGVGKRPNECMRQTLARMSCRSDRRPRPRARAPDETHLHHAGEHGHDAHLVPPGFGRARLPGERHAATRLSPARAPRTARGASAARPRLLRAAAVGVLAKLCAAPPCADEAPPRARGSAGARGSASAPAPAAAALRARRRRRRRRRAVRPEHTWSACPGAAAAGPAPRPGVSRAAGGRGLLARETLRAHVTGHPSRCARFARTAGVCRVWTSLPAPGVHPRGPPLFNFQTIDGS